MEVSSTPPASMASFEGCNPSERSCAAERVNRYVCAIPADAKAEQARNLAWNLTPQSHRTLLLQVELRVISAGGTNSAPLVLGKQKRPSAEIHSCTNSM